MDRNEQDSTIEESPINLPSLTSFAFGNSFKLTPLTTMLFDSYIVMILNDFHDMKLDWHSNRVSQLKRGIRLDSALTLLAVNLRDNSVQKTQIHDGSFLFKPIEIGRRHKGSNLLPYTLTKYGDNQILRYGVVRKGASHFSLLTIESFQRIPLF